MQLIVIPNNNGTNAQNPDDFLAFAITNEPVARVVLDGLAGRLSSIGNRHVTVALPHRWACQFDISSLQVIRYSNSIALSDEHIQLIKQHSWLAVSNGRFDARVNVKLLRKFLAETNADILTVNASSDLLACREKVRLTPQGKLAGFRRLYCDCIEPAAAPCDWPHHTFIRSDRIDTLLEEKNALPQTFSALSKVVQSNGLTLQSINIAGTSIDLSTEQGLLHFLADTLGMTSKKRTGSRLVRENSGRNGKAVPPNARIIGKALFGHNVTVGRNAIIIGPTIVGDNVTIEEGAAIISSVVAAGITVGRNQIIRNRVIAGSVAESQPSRRRRNNQKHHEASRTTAGTLADVPNMNSRTESFRIWPKFSYAGCFKRVADIVLAVAVLLLFAPVLPLIALVVRLSSDGPVFFKDKRQGLHGKTFNCLKFRTMLVGADRIQDKLRTLNFVDGPQFKMADDPRINAVGRFLRDTYIDEIPQFFNVLRGQMSVVGPRPSPESENTSCPYWRDARLSVRPGITGLWQVRRTRQPMKDFQEWIYYDTMYVRDLSLGLDLRICWQTAKKLVRNFVSQF